MKKQKAPVVKLTPEQVAENAAAAKLEAERLQKYGNFLHNASHAQLQAELKRTIRAEHFKEAGKKGKTPIPGLPIMWATVLSAVLDNTRTLGDVKRKNQINPKGRLHAYPL